MPLEKGIDIVRLSGNFGYCIHFTGYFLFPQNDWQEFGYQTCQTSVFKTIVFSLRTNAAGDCYFTGLAACGIHCFGTLARPVDQIPIYWNRTRGRGVESLLGAAWFCQDRPATLNCRVNKTLCLFTIKGGVPC
ncbi:hypothetical protein QUF90_26005 [Desulfococcaceae bacterium HSG9]|nr:hypothetical protein [Desulfococcaceae bacterium HSG9]